MNNPDDAFEDGAPEEVAPEEVAADEVDDQEPVVDFDAELQAILDEQPVEVTAEEVDPLAALAEERDAYLDQLRRVQADFENYRKRVQREMSEARDAGASVLGTKLIDVLDTVDRALTHDPSDSVAQIATALVDALGKEGLERVDAFGAAFDPELHDAVLHEEGDGPAEVIEVLRSGWKWNGRVLRPAMVKVKGS